MFASLTAWLRRNWLWLVLAAVCGLLGWGLRSMPGPQPVTSREICDAAYADREAKMSAVRQRVELRTATPSPEPTPILGRDDLVELRRSSIAYERYCAPFGTSTPRPAPS